MLKPQMTIMCLLAALIHSTSAQSSDTIADKNYSNIDDDNDSWFNPDDQPEGVEVTDKDIEN